MSRRNQDIPIRPRYGLLDVSNDDSQTHTCSSPIPQQTTSITNATTSTSGPVGEQVASSYSEIPFLAQYPGPMPETVMRDYANRAHTNAVTNVGDVDSSLEDGDDSAEENSKTSSGDASKTPKRPNSLQCESTLPYDLKKVSSTNGEMRHFVAEHLEEQLRSGSSPIKKDSFSIMSHNSTPSISMGGGLLTRHFLQTQVPQIDANALSDIEIEAQYLAASVDNLTENLCNLLHSISSITADNVEVHKNAVNKLTDSMDANIKCMYTIMAKTEEITKSMKPTEQLGQRIREIKRLVDILDNTM